MSTDITRFITFQDADEREDSERASSGAAVGRLTAAVDECYPGRRS